MALAGCGFSGGSSSPGSAKATTTTTFDSEAKAIEDGNVALCNDGGYSDNDDFSATCSGGDGIDKWLAPFGQCEDATVIKMSSEATCSDNGGFKKLLPANYKPKAAKGDVARCKDSTFSDNTDFSATCSSRGGVSKWLAPYGECTDGTVIKMSKQASCADHDGFGGLLPADYTPPTTTTTALPPTTAPPQPALPAVLTPENNPGLAALLAEPNSCSDKMRNFAFQYAGKTIEFDGSIVNVAPSGDYETRFNFLVAAGDFDPNRQVGPTFQFQDKNASYDLHWTGPNVPDSVTAGLNIRVKATVGDYDPDLCIFQLTPVSTQVR